MPLGSDHMENLWMGVYLQLIPSLVVEYFRMSQAQSFPRQNSMPSVGKNSLTVTLRFHPENSENCHPQSGGQDRL
jgi:hypothetical protein